MTLMSLHAVDRWEDRLLMGMEALEEVVRHIRPSDCSKRPPYWWVGSRAKSKKVTVCGLGWYPFKDLDGVDCVALIDFETDKIVTLGKRGVW